MANEGGGNAPGDIEKQLPDNVAAAASTNSDHPNTHASPIQQNPDDITTGQDNVRTIICRFLHGIVGFWVLIFTAFITILVCFYSVLITGDTSYLYYDGHTTGSSKEDNNKKKGSRIKMKKAANKVKIYRLTVVTAVRTGFLVLLWMVINLKVASLRRVTVLGSLLWKWCLLAALILLAYPTLMSLLYWITVVIAEAFFTNKRRSDNVFYYTRAITEGPILALYFTSLLLTWLLCVDTTNTQLHRYGTMTLVSLLVGGVLSLLKSLVLLWWRTELIYNKYKEKILSAACYLYFNLLLMDQEYSDGNFLVSWFNRDAPQELVPVNQNQKR